MSVTVTLHGPLSQDDIRLLMATFRSIERQRPDETYIMTVNDPAGRMDQAEKMVREIIPGAHVLSLRAH